MVRPRSCGLPMAKPRSPLRSAVVVEAQGRQVGPGHAHDREIVQYVHRDDGKGTARPVAADELHHVALGLEDELRHHVIVGDGQAVGRGDPAGTDRGLRLRAAVDHAHLQQAVARALEHGPRLVGDRRGLGLRRDRRSDEAQQDQQRRAARHGALSFPRGPAPRGSPRGDWPGDPTRTCCSPRVRIHPCRSLRGARGFTFFERK